MLRDLISIPIASLRVRSMVINYVEEVKESSPVNFKAQFGARGSAHGLSAV